MTSSNTDHLTAWTSHLRGRSGRTASTAKIYRRHVEKALAWIDKPLDAITLVELSNYLAELEDRGWTSNSRRVASCSLRSFFGFAAACRWIPYNPAEILGVPRSIRREVRTLTLKQVQKVVLDTGEPYPYLEQAPLSLRNRLIFALSYHLGLRAHEVTWLRLDQVEVTDTAVTVLIKASKHGRQDLRREVWDRDIADMLLIFIANHRKQLADSVWLFPSRQADRHGPGGRLSVRQIQRIFYAQLEQAGIRRKDGYRHHMLRASLATHELESGKDVHLVQQWLRHQAGSTTLLYARAVSDRRLANALFARRGIGPLEKQDIRRSMQDDLGILRPRDRGSGRLRA